MSEIDGEHYLIVFKSDGKNYSGCRGGQENDTFISVTFRRG